VDDARGGWIPAKLIFGKVFGQTEIDKKCTCLLHFQCKMLDCETSRLMGATKLCVFLEKSSANVKGTIALVHASGDKFLFIPSLLQSRLEKCTAAATAQQLKVTAAKSYWHLKSDIKSNRLCGWAPVLPVN